MMNYLEIKDNVQEISSQFAAERHERQKRRELVRSDFDDLTSAGFHLTGVLAGQGGIWENVPTSVRQICDLLRILAHGDSSVALVSSMHPVVLAAWLATPEVSPSHNSAWQEQRNFCSETALQGNFWGTITSEPGSGGALLNTKTRADKSASGYKISGLKHFGSGTGMMSFMITTAVVPGEAEPDVFFLDMRDVSLDGSRGAKLMFPWDGHGMTATQSHSVQFEGFPATRVAWPSHMLELGAAVGSFGACAFTAVIGGIIEIAVETARKQLEKRHDKLSAYEQVEWSRIQMESWLIQQAYEGMLTAIEQESPSSGRETLLGKTAIAELAESLMTRLCKVMGGGTYARHSPFGFWFQDVRALGFLRPPWVLAYERLFQGGWLDS
jgi:alkylation response protein AidB-like acyl-CoA dehydrogenase